MFAPRVMLDYQNNQFGMRDFLDMIAKEMNERKLRPIEAANLFAMFLNDIRKKQDPSYPSVSDYNGSLKKILTKLDLVKVKFQRGRSTSEGFPSALGSFQGFVIQAYTNKNHPCHITVQDIINFSCTVLKDQKWSYDKVGKFWEESFAVNKLLQAAVKENDIRLPKCWKSSVHNILTGSMKLVPKVRRSYEKMHKSRNRKTKTLYKSFQESHQPQEQAPVAPQTQQTVVMTQSVNNTTGLFDSTTNPVLSSLMVLAKAVGGSGIKFGTDGTITILPPEQK